MPRVFLVRVLISAIVLTSFARALWFLALNGNMGLMPFHVEQEGAQFVVHAEPGVPLPRPLAEGQILDLSEMGILDRAAALRRMPVPAGTLATVVVREQGRRVRATFVAIPVPPEMQDGPWLRFSGTALLTFLLGIALLTLWRGRDGTAWGLCAFSSGLIFFNGALNEPATPAASLWLVPARSALLPFTLAGLYAMAECLTGAGLPRAWRSLARAAVAGGALWAAAAGIARDALLNYEGAAGPPWLAGTVSAAMMVVLATAVLTLLSGYRGASRQSRRRMRWVLMSTGLLMASLMVLILAGPSVDNQPVLVVTFNTLLPGLAVLGYLYAILRTRVVDVTFVIDRALVFSLTTALLFGMFSLLEQTVHHLALGEQLGWLVQAMGAVAVAAALSPLHRLLDQGLEKAFFHRLHTMASALRQCATESSFYEKGDVLLSRALKQLLVPCAAAAIYERSGAVYQCRVSSGEGWPEALDGDDPAFITLRAHRDVLDLEGLESVAGAEGLGFPMIVGQLLTGAIIVRLREGEQLDRDVRAAIAELARALGTSLYLMRYREQERLIAEIAAGSVGDLSLRSRAVALIGPP